MTTSELGHLEVAQEGPVITLTINRPRKRNAMSLPMWAALHQTVAGVAQFTDAGVLVVRGADQYFSAGGDLNEVLAATASRAAATHYCRTVVQALHTLTRCSIPTVAAINGVASGGGVEIAIACDVRIANVDATLQLPMNHLGVVPDLITLARLRDAMGTVRRRWMLLHSRAVPATVCQEIGLVEQVAERAEFDTAVAELAVAITRTTPMAQKATKKLLASELPGVEDAAVPMIESFLSGEVRDAAERFLRRSRNS